MDLNLTKVETEKITDSLAENSPDSGNMLAGLYGSDCEEAMANQFEMAVPTAISESSFDWVRKLSSYTKSESKFWFRNRNRVVNRFNSKSVEKIQLSNAYKNLNGKLNLKQISV
jgi:hypothetical protein